MTDRGLGAGPVATVLVIDDDEAMRRLAAGMLSGRYRVREADGVVAGLAVLAQEPVDLVLMDVMMPGISGLDGCRRLKAAAGGFLPVLLLTALSEPADVVAGLEAGADDFLSKPVSRRELELRVATFVKLRRQEQLIERQLLELRELVALKDDLVDVLVHDLRNPLASVLSIFGLLADTAIGAEMKEDVRVGLDATKHVIALADDLLTVRLLEAGKLEPTLELCSPLVVVREAVDAQRRAAEDRHVQLSVQGAEQLLLRVDKKLLRRAVENLVGNAIKYTQGSVDVGVLPCDGGVEVTVADRGRGIPDACKPRLFEKYGSVEAQEGQARRGVGLGLYLVRMVATAHHGAICVEDRDGGGTIFRLRLGGAA